MEITRSELIEKIKEHVFEDTEERRLIAGFQGLHDDGGAGWRRAQLHAWEDGITFALTGNPSSMQVLFQKLKNTKILSGKNMKD